MKVAARAPAMVEAKVAAVKVAGRVAATVAVARAVARAGVANQSALERSATLQAAAAVDLVAIESCRLVEAVAD